MESRTAPRSRRARPAKPPLSREAIVDAALAIVRDEGVEALSMRRVAQALDTGPASLYVYVADRDELHELLFDAAAGTIETEPVRPRALARSAQGARAAHGHDDGRRVPGHGPARDGADPVR